MVFPVVLIFLRTLDTFAFIVPDSARFYGLGVGSTFILGEWRLAFAGFFFLHKVSVLLKKEGGIK